MCQPERVNATCLRKEAATLAKISGLSEIQVKELADFLGHSLRTHQDVYRLPQATLQTAKVSKYLMGIYGKTRPEEDNDTDSSIDNDVSPKDLNETEKQPDSSVNASGKRHIPDNSDSDSEYFTPKKKKGRKLRWDTPQSKAIRKHFDNDIRLGNLPGKAACLRAQKESPLTAHPALEADKR